MEKENKMGTMPVPKLVLNMSLPLMFSLVVQSLYNIVDGIYVSRLSQAALTATSLAYPVQMLMVAGSVGTSVGLNAVLSRTVGEKDYRKAGRIATTGLVLEGGLAVLFALAGIFCAGGIAAAFTQDAALAELCRQYLSVCMTFCGGIFLETLAQRLLQAVGNTFASMISLVVGAGANIILDPIMIFGRFGCPAMGIRGAAVATVIGQWLGSGAAMGIHLMKNKEVRFEIRGFRLEKSIVGAIYRVGLPTIIMQATGSVMLSVMNKILMPFSDTAVAFFGVYYKLQNFLFMPMNGLGQAAIPIVGYNLGAKKPERIRGVIRCTLPAAASVGIIGTVLFWLMPARLLGLFSAGEEMLALGVPALRIISCTFAFAAVTVVCGYVGSGLGNGVINMLGNALRQVIVLLPLAALLARTVGLSGIWFAFWAAELAAVLYAALALRREYRRKVK